MTKADLVKKTGSPSILPVLLMQIGDVLFAPGFDALEHRPERLADGGQGILDPGRHFGEDFPVDEPFGFEGFELVRQRGVGDDDLLLELIEALRPFGELLQNQNRPFAGEELLGRDVGAHPELVRLFAFLFFHEILLIFDFFNTKAKDTGSSQRSYLWIL